METTDEIKMEGIQDELDNIKIGRKGSEDNLHPEMTQVGGK